MMKFIAKLIGGLILGIIPSIWIIQNNDHIKKIILQPTLTELEKIWNAKITIKISKINLFTGTITFKDLKIESKNKIGCSWLSKSGKIELLGRKTLFSKQIKIRTELRENEIETEFSHNQYGLSILLDAIFNNAPTKFESTSFVIINGKVNITNMQQHPEIAFYGSLLVGKDEKNLWQGRLTSTSGHIKIGDTIIMNNLIGTTSFHQSNAPNEFVHFSNNHTCNLPCIKNKKIAQATTFSKNEKFFLKGKWNRLTKSIQFHNEDESISFSLTPTKNSLLASTKISLDDAFFYKKLLFTLNLGTKKNITGNYTLTITHKQTNQTYHFSGNIFVDNQNYTICGKFLDHDYIIKLTTKQNSPTLDVTVTKKGKPMVLLSSIKSTNAISGSIRYTFLQKFLPMRLRKWLLGNKGIVHLKVTKDGQKINGTIDFSKVKFIFQEIIIL